MSLQTLINRPCRIVRRIESGDTDDYGNDVPDVEEREAVCELQQVQRSEPGALGEISATEWLIFLLPSESLHTGDAIIVDDETYEITGEPWRARNPRTQLVQHIEATAKRVVGAGDEVGS